MSISQVTIGVIVAALLTRFLSALRRNHRARFQHEFRLRGGRGRVIEYRAGDRLAHLSCDMLGGGDIDLLLHIEDSHWVAPARSPFTSEDRAEILRRFDAWARTSRIQYEIDRSQPRNAA